MIDLIESVDAFRISVDKKRIRKAVANICRHYRMTGQLFVRSTEAQGDDDFLSERRRSPRLSFEIPIILRQAQVRGMMVLPSSQDPIVGVTRDFSSAGVGLVCDGHLHEKHVLAEFDCGDTLTHLVLEIRWARSKGRHQVEAGSRFIGVIKEDH